MPRTKKVNFDDEAAELFGRILIHHNEVSGMKLPSDQILKKIFQNEIDAWGE